MTEGGENGVIGAEVYVSTDIEADGPIPGSHSMLSLGSAAYTTDGTLVATFTANLQELPGATADPETVAWWAGQPQAWAAARRDPQPPREVMHDYDRWVRQLPGRPILVGYPAGYDFMFVYWYFMRFVGRSPFARSALDTHSYAMAVLGTTYAESGRDNLPLRWRGTISHTHVALDDAIEQGEIFCKILLENAERHRVNNVGKGSK
ncbi:MAG: 3'-5' exoribonuclease domain-containing protein [Pseudonocardiaceae bacterium]